jgi:hypothetical protein
LVQISAVAYSSDPAADVEQRVGYLACHHVDLIGSGYRNEHVGISGPGPLEYLRVGGMPYNASHIVTLVDAAGLLRRRVDHGDIDAFRCKMTGDG